MSGEKGEIISITLGQVIRVSDSLAALKGLTINRTIQFAELYN